MVCKELLCPKCLTWTLNIHLDFKLFQVATFRMKLMFNSQDVL